MFNIPVLLGSTRRGRQSGKVARYVHARMQATGRIESELLDLQTFAFPIMEERLRMRDDPPPRLHEFAAAIERADALVIVTPEYNHGYPGVLKNALDYLLPEYKRKPFAIVTVSAGGFGGVNCLAQLQLVALAVGAFPIPASLPVSRVGQSFSEDGPTDPKFEQRADRFLSELLWFTEAVVNQKKLEQQRESVQGKSEQKKAEQKK